MITQSKKSEAFKVGEFNANKGWFDNFLKMLDSKNVKITREAASANKEASDKLPDPIKKIVEN